MLVLSRDDVAELLDRDALRTAVGDAMAEVSAGRVSMPPRVGAFSDDPTGVMAVMPAYVPALRAMATKIVNVFPANAGTGLDTHQAIVLLVDPQTGEFLAMLDGDSITAERTAAGSALSTELMARPDARVLAIIGTGVQARSHALAVVRTRNFAEMRIAGRDAEKSAALAAALDPLVDVPVHSTAINEACRGADVVCATTDAHEPVVRREWFSPGTHITSVGFSAGGPEIDPSTVADATLVVESRATAFAPYPVGSHDLARPLADGLIDEDHVAAEIGELVAGAAFDRRNAGITLYKSAGVAAQDVAAAKLLFDAAIAQGVGTTIER
ncbi:MAG: ornithine cyclodeaminase family protein [Actinomycetota bacterium]